jgi:hypothetical protein
VQRLSRKMIQIKIKEITAMLAAKTLEVWQKSSPSEINAYQQPSIPS